MELRRNRNESLCTLNGTSFTGPAGLAVSAHGSVAGVVVVSAVKAQLQASWLMLQAGPASQTQDWNPLEMLTLVQVPLELELVLKLWAQVTVILLRLDHGSARGY